MFDTKKLILILIILLNILKISTKWCLIFLLTYSCLLQWLCQYVGVFHSLFHRCLEWNCFACAIRNWQNFSKRLIQRLQSPQMIIQKSGLLESTTLGISRKQKVTTVTSENYWFFVKSKWQSHFDSSNKKLLSFLFVQKNILTRRLKISKMLPRMRIEVSQIAKNW